MKISKEKVQEIAKALLLELTDEEANSIVNSITYLSNSLPVYHSINVDGLTPMNYISEKSNHALRADVSIMHSEPKRLIKNAKDKNDKYIILK